MEKAWKDMTPEERLEFQRKNMGDFLACAGRSLEEVKGQLRKNGWDPDIVEGV